MSLSPHRYGGGGVDTRGREALANAIRGVMVIYGKAFADWVCHPTKGGGWIRRGREALGYATKG